MDKFDLSHLLGNETTITAAAELDSAVIDDLDSETSDDEWITVSNANIIVKQIFNCFLTWNTLNVETYSSL